MLSRLAIVDVGAGWADHTSRYTRVMPLDGREQRLAMRSNYFVVARSRNFTSAARSCSEPMRCSGILVPGV